ncbi:MAG: zf-TFIIB domain-containing protein [Candidatus Omnitrophota bacterium]
MDCPKCLGLLEEKEVENVKVDVCWVCEGIWFDKNELAKVLKADAKDFNTIDVDRSGFDGKKARSMVQEFNEKSGKCPKCSPATGLEKKDFKNKIFADECPKCSGIWLDGGEIHKLRKRTLVNIYNKVYNLKESFLYALSMTFKGKKL